MELLFQRLSDIVNSNDSYLSFNGRYLEFTSKADVIQILKEHSINTEVNSDICKIDLANLCLKNCLIFYDRDDFVKRYKKQSNFDDIDICILKYNGNCLFKLKNTDFTEERALFFNYDTYQKVLAFILKSTNFVSYPSQANQEFILIDEKGAFSVNYNPLEDRVFSFQDFRNDFEKLKLMFEKMEFQQFFKDSVIQSLKNIESKNRFFKLIESLSVLLNIAERDYNIYIRNFGFDKIKSRFKEERAKYFESLERNIESINKQVTAFPLTFSASIFASYQVREQPTILFFIFSAYLLYTIIAWIILNVSKSNLDNTKSDVDYESNQIKNTFNTLYDEFKSDFDKINSKIKQLYRLIYWLRAALIILILMFLIFVYYQVEIFGPEYIVPKILVHN